MATFDLNYPLSDDFIHNWLVAGPLATPLSAVEPGTPPEALALAALRQHYAPDSGVTEPPVEVGPLGAGLDAAWRYYRTRADHFVDLTATHHRHSYLRAWAYAQVTVPAAQQVELVLTTHGPADVWLNGQPAQRVEHFDAQRPRSVSFPVALQAGTNEILVRFETVGVNAAPLVMALRLSGAVDATVVLPTNIEPELGSRRLGLEFIAETPTLDRYVYGYLDGDLYDKNEPILARFPDDLSGQGELTFRLQSLQGDIFQERTPQVTAGMIVPLARTFPLRGGPHHLAIAPNASDYYQKLLRFERKELFFIARTPYTVKAGATFEARAQEALVDATNRRSGSLYTEIARMALGQMDKVEARLVQRAITGLQERRDGSVRDLLGALVAVRRFGKKKPRLDKDQRLAFEQCAANYRYAPDDGRPGGLDVDGMDFSSESRQLLFHTCEILAGQLLPERPFTATGRSGQWHRERGEAAALVWLRRHGAHGLRQWHSPAALEEIVAALAVLIDLADNEAVGDLAAVMLDKVLFGLAVNSFQGAYGASRGATDLGSALSARLEPTSGVARLLWARGNFNEHLLGVVCLALCRKYALPDVIRQAATEPVDAFWSRERHVQPTVPHSNGHLDTQRAWPWQVETATYKARDFMLASAQDYAPGSLGQAEHIWQATLGPDAVVFVNHPANASLDDARRPNFWVGNGLLPRVAQWGDVLIALHRLPTDDWLCFTHAYFPTTAFDEHKVDGQWAFARKGQGYLALRAEAGLEFLTTGSTAFRELRSPGLNNAWLCHMGQALLDGSFEEFQAKIKALDVSVDGLALKVQTLRGDRLAFDWEGPLLINGEAQPLAPGRHIENPYCIADLPAAEIDIVAEGEGVRLKFE